MKNEEERGAVAKRGQILDSLEQPSNNPPDLMATLQVGDLLDEGNNFTLSPSWLWYRAVGQPC